MRLNNYNKYMVYLRVQKSLHMKQKQKNEVLVWKYFFKNQCISIKKSYSNITQYLKIKLYLSTTSYCPLRFPTLTSKLDTHVCMLYEHFVHNSYQYNKFEQA